MTETEQHGELDHPERRPDADQIFALSFVQLDASDPAGGLAWCLLARAACFAPGEPFGRDWLEATIATAGGDGERARADALARLLDLGLLEPVGPESLRLDRLLATFAAFALADDAALGAVERVVNTLAAQATATGMPRAIRPVLPHLRHCVRRAQEVQREDGRAAALFQSLGAHLKQAGSYAEARPLLERALELRERVLGAGHPDTVVSLNSLADLYRAQGAYDLARPLLERALELRERVLGADHPDTAQSLNNLAALCEAQGAYQRALPLYERALAICERVLGADHPATAASLNNLAGLYRALGDCERALPLLERALGITERALGADHPATATSLNNLAGLYDAQGLYARAAPLLERALALRERVLGADHPDTAQSLNNLASLYEAQGLYERATPLLERALALREQMLGAGHPSTATSLSNLARLYEAQGLYERAAPLLERALALRERALETGHPSIAASLNNLAVCYARQGLFAAALPLLEQAIQIWQARLGPRHPTVAQARQSLANIRLTAAIAALPEAVCAALRAQDSAALQRALDTLPLEEACAAVGLLSTAGLIRDRLELFAPLLQAVAAVVLRDSGQRALVEVALERLEARDFHLTAAAQAIWAGQRNAAALTAGLDATDTALIERVLALLGEEAA